jgi:hypothetical protein
LVHFNFFPHWRFFQDFSSDQIIRFSQHGRFCFSSKNFRSNSKYYCQFCRRNQFITEINSILPCLTIWAIKLFHLAWKQRFSTFSVLSASWLIQEANCNTECLKDRKKCLKDRKMFKRLKQWLKDRNNVWKIRTVLNQAKVFSIIRCCENWSCENMFIAAIIMIICAICV